MTSGPYRTPAAEEALNTSETVVTFFGKDGVILGTRRWNRPRARLDDKRCDSYGVFQELLEHWGSRGFLRVDGPENAYEDGTFTFVAISKIESLKVTNRLVK